MNLIEILRSRRGKMNIISARELTLQSGMASERAVRMEINRLRTEQGAPIGSSFGHPSGYWWIDDPQELDEVVSRLRDFGIKNIMTASAMEKHGKEIRGQLVMKL